MTAPAIQRHAGGRPRASSTHYPCGHERSSENTYTRRRATGSLATVDTCRACRRRTLGASKVRTGIITRGPLSLTRDVFVPRQPIPLSPSIVALIEECRAEYEEAVGQLELFTALPRRFSCDAT